MNAPDIKPTTADENTGHFMLPGHALWKLRGQPVWAGSLRQPVEDLAYDEIVLHWTDIAKIEGEAWYGQA
jgi:hypothetical protein